ncbi:hypothetical protein D3H64_06035 [Atopobacter sp. AH10]|uniref:Gp15 family bacteriophage protein n=1 Tax=Atopobacter sp. AH10 TaxID=2315861 RepID=UPI000EF25626|nr:Gp15 family bacteriophage protein [Atopobacter sp. AH10]RLK63151.1 hypothetical protein D3H64_06035 [Atopobacter sp. AH10]
MDISRKLPDTYIVVDQVYTLNLAYNVVLKVLELMRDKDLDDLSKLRTALFLLLGDDVSKSLSIEEMDAVCEDLFEQFIAFDNEDEQVVRDIKGNIIPKEIIEKSKAQSDEEDDDQPLYDIMKDGEYIYASFLQAYGIDLFEEQGKLHWYKFNALLVSLPSDTKFMEVLRIRAWKPSKGDSSEYKKQMRKQQEIYRL